MALILIADDDEGPRRMVAVALERHGYTVAQVDDGKAVLPFLAANDPQLLITDIVMLDQEGLETIRAVREINKVLPIIAISSGGDHGGHLYLELALKFGANAALEKPFMPSELIEVVDKLLAAAAEPAG